MGVEGEGGRADSDSVARSWPLEMQLPEMGSTGEETGLRSTIISSVLDMLK